MRRASPALVALGALLLLRGYLNTFGFDVTHTRTRLPGLRAPLRVAQLTDLHYGMFHGPGSMRAWVDATLNSRPDVIVVTGDFIEWDGAWRDWGDLMRELARLRAPLGVYFVWGNHDYRSVQGRGTLARFFKRLRSNDSLEDLREQLQQAGLTDLNNSGRQLRPDVYLAGVDDPVRGKPDLDAAYAKREGGASILLCHNPLYLETIRTRADLTLCGHTHGGQITIPMLRPLERFPLLGPKYVSGWIHAPAHAYVSHGLGVNTIPVRLNCPAQLVVFDLYPQV